jgi:hypothetical protein
MQAEPGQAGGGAHVVEPAVEVAWFHRRADRRREDEVEVGPCGAEPGSVHVEAVPVLAEHGDGRLRERDGTR